MATDAQIAANQGNAQHSTGPKTAEGKERSSRNSILHGFTGKFKLLAWENHDEYIDLLFAFGAEHQPQSPAETALIERMAQHFWLVQRALTLQHNCFRPDLAGEEANRQLALYLRYQTTQERSFEKCAAELRKLRGDQRNSKIGFESLQRRKAEDTRRETREARQQAREARDQANEQRRQNGETRKQEMHEARVRLVNSKAQQTEINNDRRKTIELPVPENLRVPFDTLKTLLATAVEQVNRDLTAKQAA